MNKKQKLDLFNSEYCFDFKGEPENLPECIFEDFRYKFPHNSEIICVYIIMRKSGILHFINNKKNDKYGWIYPDEWFKCDETGTKIWFKKITHKDLLN